MLASCSQTNKPTDLRLVLIERSISVDHFSSLDFENSSKKIELCSVKVEIPLFPISLFKRHSGMSLNKIKALFSQ